MFNLVIPFALQKKVKKENKVKKQRKSAVYFISKASQN